jgi:WXXGXW repeat (2 copies)
MEVLQSMRNLTLIALLSALPCASFSQSFVGVSITTAPPELPVYEQPLCPQPNYMWTPGYWAWGGPNGYYWVPGAWIMAPAVGLLWTPGYWGWSNGLYAFNTGYWGPQVGFYGGVNYGYGYSGMGFGGGRWNGGNFNYNTAVTRVNTTVIRNTYVDRTMINNINGNRVSYNGGQGGINVRPNQAQIAAEHHKRFGPANKQVQQERLARQDRANLASVNHGTPPHAPLAKPAAGVPAFNHAVPASGARPVKATEARPVATAKSGTATQHPTTNTHLANENKPVTRPEAKPATTRPTAESRPAPKPVHETKPAPSPRPIAAVRSESKPAPVEHARAETKLAPESRLAQATQRPEPAARPAPEARPVQTAARPAPQHESAPKPSEEKPHPDQQ